MNIAITFAYILIAALIIWVFMLSRTISKQGEQILTLTNPTPPAPVEPAVGRVANNNNSTPVSDTINAGEFWNGFQKNAKEIKMEVTFDKSQA